MAAPGRGCVTTLPSELNLADFTDGISGCVMQDGSSTGMLMHFWGAAMRAEPERVEARLQELVGWFQQGRLHPRVHAVYPLERAADALHEVLGRGVAGKVVLSTGLAG